MPQQSNAPVFASELAQDDATTVPWIRLAKDFSPLDSASARFVSATYTESRDLWLVERTAGLPVLQRSNLDSATLAFGGVVLTPPLPAYSHPTGALASSGSTLFVAFAPLMPGPGDGLVELQCTTQCAQSLRAASDDGQTIRSIVSRNETVPIERTLVFFTAVTPSAPPTQPGLASIYMVDLDMPTRVTLKANVKLGDSGILGDTPAQIAVDDTCLYYIEEPAPAMREIRCIRYKDVGLMRDQLVARTQIGQGLAVLQHGPLDRTVVWGVTRVPPMPPTTPRVDDGEIRCIRLTD